MCPRGYLGAASGFFPSPNARLFYVAKGMKTSLRSFNRSSISGLLQSVVFHNGRRLAAAGSSLGQAFYPSFCEICCKSTSAGSHLCTECAAGTTEIPKDIRRICTQCSRVFSGEPPLVARCADCCARNPAFSCAVAPYKASGPVREIIHHFKYQGKRYLINVLAPWIAEGFLDPRLQSPPPQVLVPVPLHWWKLRRRGFNQSELLARRLLAEIPNAMSPPSAEFQPGHSLKDIFPGLCVREVLRRHRATGTQTVLDRTSRLKNLQRAFSLKAGADVSGQHIVLVDDVLTTGATLDACASVLHAAGAASVRALAVARG